MARLWTPDAIRKGIHNLYIPACNSRLRSVRPASSRGLHWCIAHRPRVRRGCRKNQRRRQMRQRCPELLANSLEAKPEIRRPKTEIPQGGTKTGVRNVTTFAIAFSSNFGLRISFGPRNSVFGFMSGHSRLDSRFHSVILAS